MKRFILHGLVMLLTFAFGFGLERVIRYRLANEIAPVALLPLAELNVIPMPATSAMPGTSIAAEPSPPPKATFIFDYDRKQIIRHGVFYIYGRAPAQFADVPAIELDLVGDDPSDDGYITINAGFAGGRYDWAMATFALITERRLFFATSPSRQEGVEYRFDGEFATKDLYSVQGKNKVALRGTLTKTKNGRKIAEAFVSFRVELMGC